MRQPEQENQPLNLGKEQESRPKALVTFFGHDHTPFNLQAIPRITSTFTEHLKQAPPNGTNILFTEYTTGRQSDRKKLHEGIEATGGIYSYYTFLLLIPKLSRYPTLDELNTRIQQIESVAPRAKGLKSADLSTILRKGLMPIEFINQLFLMREIQELTRKYPFEIDIETHTDRVLEQNSVLYKEFEDALNKSVEYWNNGEFDLALDSKRKSKGLEASAVMNRDKEIANYLGDKIRSFFKGNGGGSIFILMGDAHYPLNEMVKGRFDPKIPLTFQSFSSVTSTDPRIEIIQTLRKGIEPSDLLYSKDMLYLTMKSQIPSWFARAGNLTAYANNFESIDSIILQIVNTFDPNQVRKICEKQTDPIRVLLSHPLSAPLRDYNSKRRKFLLF